MTARATRAAALAAACALLASCATLPPPPAKTATHALADPEATALGALVAAAAPDPRRSGFRLLVSGEDAYAALHALAGHAQRTLDLQYYLMHDEASTRALLERVRAAAARGVRVRLLLDDMHTSGADDALRCLARHPNIELRLYNPFPSGRTSTLTRVLASLTDIRRLNRRMHAKMFVADNALAVAGGRNLGDAYFVQSPSSNFVDLDVLAAGPIVRRLSDSFDRFWNSELAYPLQALAGKEPRCEELAPAGSTPARSAAPVTALPTAALQPTPPAATPSSPADSTLAQEFAAGLPALAWARARLLADEPSKITREAGPDPEEIIADDVMALMRSARSEVIVITPYFVPGERGLQLARELAGRGVKLRMLTNSLAATDAPIVHIGYARYRPALLAAGVELHEMRYRLGAPRSRLGPFGSSLASLHAKAMVVDRRIVLVGSMNMDPRSVRLNAELALAIRSAELASQVAQLYEDVAVSSSYRVEAADDGRLRWVGAAPGMPTVEGHEPDASLGLRMVLWLLAPLAPDEVL